MLPHWLHLDTRQLGRCVTKALPRLQCDPIVKHLMEEVAEVEKVEGVGTYNG